MQRNRKGTAPRSASARLQALYSNRRTRTILLRHALPVVFALLLVLLSVLPLVTFRTGNGESDARSLVYWHHANFFGTDGARGAYELLTTVDSGNMYYSFYRSVVVLCIVDAVAGVLGLLLTLALSITAIYLLVTEEEGEHSRFVGRVFRVAVGNRWAALIPYVLSVIPFTFPKLFAYFSTALRSFDTAARFPLIDPLWIALAILAVEFVLILRARDRERRTKWDLYLSPELRTVKTRESDETRAWEAAVKADAENDGIVIAGMGDLPEAPKEAKPPEPPGTEGEPNEPDESAYGETVFPEKDAEARAEAPNDGETDAEEMRSSIRALFSESEETEQKPKHRKKK